MSGYCPEGSKTCRDADSGPCVVGHPCELHPLPELALLMDSGLMIYDRTWRCVADVMKSFHGFGGKVYGVIVDAETMVQVYPPLDPPTATETSVVLG